MASLRLFIPLPAMAVVRRAAIAIGVELGVDVGRAGPFSVVYVSLQYHHSPITGESTAVLLLLLMFREKRSGVATHRRR